MTDYKAELAVLMAMTPEERSVHFLQQKVDMELHWLQEVIAEHRPDRLYNHKGNMELIREQRRVVQRWQKRLSEARQRLEKSERKQQPNE